MLSCARHKIKNLALRQYVNVHNYLRPVWTNATHFPNRTKLKRHTQKTQHFGNSRISLVRGAFSFRGVLKKVNMQSTA